MAKKLFKSLTSGPVYDVPTPPMKRRVLYGDHILTGTNVLEEGLLVPKHQHPEEQISYIIYGTCRITTWTDESGTAAGDIPHTVEAGPGDAAWFGSNMAHEILMHEECLIMDIFNVLREDWVAQADELDERG